ncbi:hypothetical protein [Dactylosporangium sp. CA-092794]|uniref:hypothetical protein n=1 Tax=Dactylosporangium sp. CA-092794 TaxID=3239929 RepID=UPI003D8CCFC2
MSIVDDNQQTDDQQTDDQTTDDQVPALVERAAILLRFQPVPGSDPGQAREWLRSVAEFLSSAALREVLDGLVAPPPSPAGASA